MPDSRRRSTRLSSRAGSTSPSTAATSGASSSTTTTSRSKVTKRTATNQPKAKAKSKSKDKPAKPTHPTSHAALHDAATHARILGGLNGDYRATGTSKPTEADSGLLSFTIPFRDVGRDIVCEAHGVRTTSTSKPAGAAAVRAAFKTSAGPRLIFTHGAGGGIENPATRAFAAGFGAAAPAVAFQGTMNLPSRVKSFRAVVDALVDWDKGVAPLVLGGRSMGARAAVMCCNQLDGGLERLQGGMALVLVSYPLVGGKDGADVRDGILKEIAEDVNVLFVVGDRDHMCDLKKLDSVRKAMKARSWLVIVEGADHSMSLKQKDGVESMRRETGRLAAEWVANKDAGQKYCSISWDRESERVEGGEWRGSL